MGLGDDGGGGPRGGRPGPHARGRARSAPGRHRRRDLPAGLRRRGQHDALVLPPPPLRPAAPAPLRPPLAGGLGGLPGLQPGHGRRVVARAGQGDAVLVQDYHFSLLGRMLAEARPGPAHGALLAHALRRARHARRCCPTTCVAELLDGMAGYSACGFHCHQWEAGFVGLLRRGRARPAPAHLRGAARPRRRRARGGGGVARRAPRRPRRCGPRWAGAASSPAPTAWSPRRTSCGGCSPSRSC